MKLTIEEQLRERCKELELKVKSLNKALEANRETGFIVNTTINPETGKMELFSVVYIVSDNQVTPLFRRGILDTENNTVHWIPLEETRESV